MPAEHKWIHAYGDREGDGMVQMSFVLPLPPSAKAKEAARHFAEAHGLVDPLVTTMEEAAAGFSYFVVYGRSSHTLDVSTITVPEIKGRIMSREAVESQILAKVGRRVVVVGACTGSDAHTVGIDAVINYKGFAGDKGLEAYKCFEAHNLGAQVENEELLQRAQSLRADVILVSQVVTARNCHRENALALVELVQKQGLLGRFVLLLGGPRIDHKLAIELGFDAGFGPGTKPSEVASFLAHRLAGDDPKGAPSSPPLISTT